MTVDTSRSSALDITRGLLLVVSVGVNAWFTAPTWFGHAPWIGVHPVDLVFPAFVTLSGAGLAILYSRRLVVAREARRVLVLLAAGVAYTVLVHVLARGELDPSALRVTGVLQLYAVVVLVVAVLSRWATAWWRWLVVAGVLAAVHTAVSAHWSVRCGGLTPECNPSVALDVAALGRHAYAEGRLGHDPEGLVAILGALICATVGAAAGRALADGDRVPVSRAVVIAAVAGAGWWSTALVVPTFKRLWTAPFAFAIASVVATVLIVASWLLDHRGVSGAERVARLPLVALGRNSLLVYFGSHALMDVLLHTGPHGPPRAGGSSWAETLSASLTGLTGTAAAFVAAAILGWTVLAVVLHRFGLYLKA